jgi:hypothetical protein
MKLTHLLIGLLLLYVLVTVLLNVFLGKMVFLPKKLAQDHVFTFAHESEERWLEGEELRVNALFFPATDSSKGLVLYLHGNADNLQRWGAYTIDFTSRGYDVLAIDYPGYGKSPGTPTEASVYASAELAWQWAVDHYSADRILIYGRSLGSAPASYLSSRHRAKLLILETPFYSMPDILHRRNPIGPWLNDNYQFPNQQFLADSQNEAYIFQGTADRTVPYASALKLKPLLSDSSRFIVIEGGGHRNLREFPRYQAQLAAVLEEK